MVVFIFATADWTPLTSVSVNGDNLIPFTFQTNGGRVEIVLTLVAVVGSA